MIGNRTIFYLLPITSLKQPETQMTSPKNLHIGDFLSQKLDLPEKELRKLLNMQEYLNDKIGETALRENLIKNKEMEEILCFQKKHNISFGNAAIYLGFMKNSHVKYLLDIQAQTKNRIGELIVQKGLVTQEDFLKILEEFYSKKQIQFTILALIRGSLSKEVQQAVTRYGYRFQSCTEQEEIELYVEELKPQLILLDSETERVIEYSQKLKRDTPSGSFKIALFSDTKEKLEMLSGYDFGIDYFLPVPFDLKNLINIMIDNEFKSGEQRKERILVVDDSSIARQSIAEELTGTGFQVLFAENGAEAVGIAPLEKPDLIVMDINMPVMNGYQACLQLKRLSNTNRIPIVVLTINNTREEREKGFDVGATEYFTKPFAKGHLSAYIKHLLSGSAEIRTERILVGENDPICRNIYETILNKYGFRFELVENGQKVLDLLEKGFKPSAILLDRHMPEMDGLKACHKLKMNDDYRHIPVIISTKEKEDISEGLKVGANDYILKPFDGDELIARIEVHVKNFTLSKNFKNKSN